MCGLPSGRIFTLFFLCLFISFLAPNAFAVTVATPNVIDMTLNNMGQWELSNLPSTTGPSTISDGPSFYYFTNPNNTPAVDSSGNVTADLPAPALPVPGESSGITGITSSDLVKASDIAAALAPVLTTLAGLSPTGRALIVGGSTLWSMYENYYNTVNTHVAPSSPTLVSGCTQSPVPAYTCPSGETATWVTGNTDGYQLYASQIARACIQSNGSVGTTSAMINCSTSSEASTQYSDITNSTSSSPPAPSLSDVTRRINGRGIIRIGKIIKRRTV